ncbi:malto-oligosyltrehalose trehalohydrolase [Thiocapsa bogorovii]|uniref:malto-oligosyltrehalose trehalohydrolase n=1 Tax=Thiocapsa bogorovii TaxID=521689 RepID=UPI001E290F3F|nr:malto-oligosyltrehalose trehalohydrolase [Thiocapsa bogorovii]UHD14672.1 malto-oligosyltrehalose trehalohydrolase [Thiocapsa bogorovii]
MTARQQTMPFGAAVERDGSVRFRLWAPAARRIELCLKHPVGERCLEMPATGAGWFECRTAEARQGTLYSYRIDGGIEVPDPASRFQPQDVHGPSEVIDPAAFDWGTHAWQGRPWHEAVCYELHIGTFTREGSFDAAIERLDHLVALGITAIQLMPVADFPGQRNWGYDGALLFAPDASYGRPDDLKRLVLEAHRRGLMVFLDVVYNHFGPEGNYLHLYAPQFFTEHHHTPWGAAINFDGPESREVRAFFIHNALYWLNEYEFDGLRLDAVHAILDDSHPDVLTDLAETVRAGPGRDRCIHLILENDSNAAGYLARDDRGAPRRYTAQWNDDFHHVAHLIATGERDGYYADYADRPLYDLARCLAEGFAFQGEPSRFRHGKPRGERSADLPPDAFVNWLQTHDQVGNRAFGERLHTLASPETLKAMLAILLLAPSPPLLFMGEEWMAQTPFLFFCDFGEELARSVSEGRRQEFARFAAFAERAVRRSIPDPNDPETFTRCKLDWNSASEPRHREWLAFHRKLLELRRREIVPRIERIRGGAAEFARLGDQGVSVCWELVDGTRLVLGANLSDAELRLPEPSPHIDATLLHLEPPEAGADLYANRLPAWSVVWYLKADSIASGGVEV